MLKKAFLGFLAGVLIAAMLIGVQSLHAQTPPPTTFAQQTPIAAALTATGAATAVRGLNVTKTYQVWGTTSSGVGTATVVIEGGNDATRWDTVGTVTLTLGTTATNSTFTSLDRYTWLRANVTTLTGTGASVTATMGY